MNNLTIEQLLYSNYIKYDRLRLMTNEVFMNSTANHINIFIDMHSLLKSIYNTQNILINNYTCIASSIINLCAHFRDFYNTRYGVSSNIYIIYGNTHSPLNKKFIMDYNAKEEKQINVNTQITNLINDNIDLLEIICPYLPDVFFIKGNYEPSVLILDVISKNSSMRNRNPNIVITKEIYPYQLTGIKAFGGRIVIFRPHKLKGQDESYYISDNNIYNTYISINKKSDVNKVQHLLYLDASLFTLLLSISNLPERNIHSIFNIRNALQIIDRLIKSLDILNMYTSDIKHVSSIIDLEKSVLIENRFKAIDAVYQHKIFMSTADSLNITFPNLYDPQGIRKINDKYFKTNPLDLNRL